MKNTILNIIIAFSLSLLSTGCTLFELDDPTQEANLSEVITLAIDSSFLPADGQSSRILTATLGTEADADQSVTFKTSDGKLSDLASTVSPDSETIIEIKAGTRTAQAILTAGTEANDQVKVIASVGDFEVFQEIEFKPALPELATLQPDAYQLGVGSGTTTTLRVNCYRDQGQVSDGTLIRVSAAQKDTSTANARFDELAVLTNGEAMTEISPVGQGTGVLVFTVKIPTDGDSLIKEVEILFE